MFQEINPDLIKQSADTSKKRWFRDAESECDLFLWQDQEGKLKRFQFWYQEAVVEWDRDTGIRTGHMDNLSGSFVHYQSRLFRLHRNLDQDIIQGVKELLQDKKDLLETEMTEIRAILRELADHT
jgi:hypothetical protein